MSDIGDKFQEYLASYNETMEERMVEAYPADPNGDMVPILSASVEAAKARHPSASGSAPGVILTAADRCDTGCGAGAVYRVTFGLNALDYCGHHWRKHMPAMAERGWTVVGTNPDLVGEPWDAVSGA